MEQENVVPEEQTTVPEEKFEISLRLLGNEILAMALMSQSKKKNWVIFGLISLILIMLILERTLPVIEKVQGIV